MMPSARSTLRWRALCDEHNVKARASLSANSAASTSSAATGFKNLIATSSPVAVVLAMMTLPNVPSPKLCRRMYSERRCAGKGGPCWGHELGARAGRAGGTGAASDAGLTMAHGYELRWRGDGMSMWTRTASDLAAAK